MWASHPATVPSQQAWSLCPWASPPSGRSHLPTSWSGGSAWLCVKQRVFWTSPQPYLPPTPLSAGHQPYTSHTRDQASPSRNPLVLEGRKREKQFMAWNNLKKVSKSGRASGPTGRAQATPQVVDTQPVPRREEEVTASSPSLGDLVSNPVVSQIWVPVSG